MVTTVPRGTVVGHGRTARQKTMEGFPMGAMSDLAAAITNLAEGNEISAEDRTQIRLYLDHMTAQDSQATNAREGEQPTTVKLRDGRVVDVFPSGNVQVYAVDLRSGYELPLPQVRQSTGRVRLIPLG